MQSAGHRCTRATVRMAWRILWRGTDMNGGWYEGVFARQRLNRVDSESGDTVPRPLGEVVLYAERRWAQRFILTT